MRGSSIPQISSGYSLGQDISVGSLSISHLSTPFAERAAQRCDKPRRSSTRQSSKVSPSASFTAPELKTLLIGYGQSFRLRMGLAGWRVNKEISSFMFERGCLVRGSSGHAVGRAID